MSELLRPSLVSLSYQEDYYDLDRKGSTDQERHQRRVKEAIKQNLGEIVSEEAIITSDGNTIVKIPIRSIELPRFRYGSGHKQLGQGSGGTKPGDIIGRVPDQTQGSGKGKGQAGDQPGTDYYEMEMTIDDLAKYVFEDLGLPGLERKGRAVISVEDIRYNDIIKKGLMSNLDKKRTLLENLRRNARAGEAKIGGINNDDLRFKFGEPHIREESNAAVIAMRDVSGSMGEFEKYITRSFYFWMVRFLRTQYNQVKIVFLTHHTEAKEVDEQAFFNLGESGGTKVSSVYQLALDISKDRFPASEWNVYPFHFTDGDNWGEVDNNRCLSLVEQGLDERHWNVFGYGEINDGGRRSMTTLMSTFSKMSNPRFIGVSITGKDQVFPAIREFFKKDRVLEGAVPHER